MLYQRVKASQKDQPSQYFCGKFTKNSISSTYNNNYYKDGDTGRIPQPREHPVIFLYSTVTGTGFYSLYKRSVPSPVDHLMLVLNNE
jgi:hypothetical protein